MNKMEHDKMKNNYWLRIPQLLWFVPACYQLCILPISLLDIQGMIEILLWTIIGLLCSLCYDNKVGKVTAWICVGIWLAVVLVLVYACIQSEFSIVQYMVPSFRIAVFIELVTMLLVPLFLIFHKRIMMYKYGKILSIIFTVLVVIGTSYSFSQTYVMQDKLVCEEYRKCKELVTQIENYKEENGRYPSELIEINAKESFLYELSQDGKKYKIIDLFEHWHDRCYVDYCTFSVESITYDSETRKWEHDRP